MGTEPLLLLPSWHVIRKLQWPRTAPTLCLHCQQLACHPAVSLQLQPARSLSLHQAQHQCNLRLAAQVRHRMHPGKQLPRQG